MPPDSVIVRSVLNRFTYTYFPVSDARPRLIGKVSPQPFAYFVGCSGVQRRNPRRSSCRVCRLDLFAQNGFGPGVRSRSAVSTSLMSSVRSRPTRSDCSADRARRALHQTGLDDRIEGLGIANAEATSAIASRLSACCRRLPMNPECPAAHGRDCGLRRQEDRLCAGPHPGSSMASG